MPERQKADCDTAVWQTLTCGLHTCCCAFRFEKNPVRIMPFCLSPRGIASQTEGRVQQQKMPSLLCFYDALSYHAYVFLFVSMHLETELLTQEDMLPHKEMPTQ